MVRVTAGERSPHGGEGLGTRFWGLWSCVAVNNTADGATMIALAWAATTVTDDALLIALVAASQRLPWLVLALPFGLVIDRSERLRLMAGASAVRALALAVLAALFLTGNGSVAALCTVAFVFGATEVLFDTAAETAVPQLVAPGNLARANGHLRTAEIAANDFLGRPVGGLLLRAGTAVPFLVGSVASVLVAVTLARAGKGVPRPGAGRRQPLLVEARAGLATVWRTPALRLLALAAVGINTLFAAVLASQVLFVQQVLGLGSLGYGLLLAVASVGAVAGSQSAAPVVRRLGPATTLVLALAVTGACYLGVAASAPRVPAVGGLYAVAGAAVAAFSVASLTVRQAVTPAGVLGRVSSVLRLATWGMSTIGLLLGGAAVELLRQVVSNSQALRLPYAVTGVAYLLLAAGLSHPLRRALAQR